MSDHTELRQLAEVATPGPWDAECNDGEGEVQVNAGTARTEWHEGGWGTPARSWRTTDRILDRDDLWDDEFEQVANDAEFIAAANPATILALLDEVESLRARAERAEAAIADALEPRNIGYGHIDLALERVGAVLRAYNEGTTTS